MADMHQSSDSQQRALPEKVELPQITGLTTAFPMEIDSQPRQTPHRNGDTRQPRRHQSGH